ncbi:MAG: T9SS type A sorting domain-containing protein [Bacteroidota bacterium]
MKRKLLLSLTILISTLSFGQDEMATIVENAKAKLDSVNTESFSTKYFLNQGFLVGDLMRDFIEFKDDKEGNFIVNSRGTFRRIYKGLRKSFTGKVQKIPKIEFKEIKENYRGTDVVPVGIIQTRGEWLEGYEIDENINAQKEGHSLSKEYNRYDVFNSSVLVKKVYTGNVNFKILPEAYYVKSENRIQSISMDVSDGKGFKPIASGDMVSATYTSTGEKSIAIKFKLKNKEFISYSVLKVVTTDEEQPTMVWNLGDNSTSKNASTERRLGGGTATIYAGCDGVLDRPVIIVEGFDPLNDNSASDIRAKYNAGNIERTFRNNGYDVIYLDFFEGGRDIRDNALAVRDLIEAVNQEKIGNNDIIVIGESMGGIVARYAIRRLMEMQGRTHNVSHFISFDAPHLGANVPVGFQRLFRQVEDVYVVDVFNIAASSIREGNAYLNSKAAKQLLLRYEGPNPHPDHNALQSTLNSIGFPRQGGIRNICITNGSLNGSVNEPLLDYNPGDKTLVIDGRIALGTLKVESGTYTNRINASNTVAFLKIVTLWLSTNTYKTDSYNFNAFNYDIANGGTFDLESSDGSLPIDLDVFPITPNTLGRSRFSFVPFFSSVASTAPRTSQTNLFRSEAQLRTNNWTPFDRIFGSNANTTHTSTRSQEANQGWRNLFSQELNLPFNPSCRVSGRVAQPVSPVINAPRFYMCKGSTTTFNVDNPSAINNYYNHSWRVTGPASFNFNGEAVALDRTMPPGQYTVRVTRSFNTSSTGLNSGSRSASVVFTIFPENDTTNGCGGSPGGPGGVARNGQGKSDLKEEPLIEEEPVTIIEDSLVYWPNPVDGKLNINFTTNEDGDIFVSLSALNQSNLTEVIITDSFRPAGTYEETFLTDGLKGGIYLLTIRTSTQIIKKKVIINH